MKEKYIICVGISRCPQEGQGKSWRRQEQNQKL